MVLKSSEYLAKIGKDQIYVRGIWETQMRSAPYVV